MRETATLPHYYFNLKKEKKSGDARRIELDAGHFADSGAGRSAEVHQEDRHGEPDRERAAAGARHARSLRANSGSKLFAKRPGSSVTAVKAPAGMDSGVIVKGFKERFGAIIANGQGSMKGQIFRMAHLGYFDFADMFGIIAGLELILRANGHKVELGKGVAAVQRVYEAAKARTARLASLRPDSRDRH